MNMKTFHIYRSIKKSEVKGDISPFSPMKLTLEKNKRTNFSFEYKMAMAIAHDKWVLYCICVL